VIVVGEGAAAAPDLGAAHDRARALRAAGMTRRQIVAELVAQDGVARNVAYRIAHETGGEDEEDT
jgi:phosphohistidine phosphatase SixA